MEIKKETKSLIKVFLQFVITEKMTNVLLGQYNHPKCYMIIQRKQFIILML